MRTPSFLPVVAVLLRTPLLLRAEAPEGEGCVVVPDVGASHAQACQDTTYESLIRTAAATLSSEVRSLTVRFALEPFTACLPTRKTTSSPIRAYAHPIQPYAVALWLDSPTTPAQCNFRVAHDSDNPCTEDVSASWIPCTAVRAENLARGYFTSKDYIVVQVEPLTLPELNAQMYTVAYESTHTLFNPFFDIPPYVRLKVNSTQRESSS